MKGKYTSVGEVHLCWWKRVQIEIDNIISIRAGFCLQSIALPLQSWWELKYQQKDASPLGSLISKERRIRENHFMTTSTVQLY